MYGTVRTVVWEDGGREPPSYRIKEIESDQGVTAQSGPGDQAIESVMKLFRIAATVPF